MQEGWQWRNHILGGKAVLIECVLGIQVVYCSIHQMWGTSGLKVCLAYYQVVYVVCKSWLVVSYRSGFNFGAVDNNSTNNCCNLLNLRHLMSGLLIIRYDAQDTLHYHILLWRWKYMWSVLMFWVMMNVMNFILTFLYIPGCQYWNALE